MIYFRKLYSEPKGGQDGFSIIAYKKIPLVINVVDGVEKTSKYGYILKIDLWMFVLHFHWEREVV